MKRTIRNERLPVPRKRNAVQLLVTAIIGGTIIELIRQSSESPASVLGAAISAAVIFALLLLIRGKKRIREDAP